MAPFRHIKLPFRACLDYPFTNRRKSGGKTEPLAEKFSKIFSEVTAVDDLESEMGIQETRKKLKRELRAEAMTRLEEAARTEADFETW